MYELAILCRTGTMSLSRCGTQWHDDYHWVTWTRENSEQDAVAAIRELRAGDPLCHQIIDFKVREV